MQLFQANDQDGEARGPMSQDCEKTGRRIDKGSPARLPRHGSPSPSRHALRLNQDERKSTPSPMRLQPAHRHHHNKHHTRAVSSYPAFQNAFQRGERGLVTADSPHQASGSHARQMAQLDRSISEEHQRMIDDAAAVAAAADAAAYGGTGRDVPAAPRSRLQHSDSQQQRHHSSTSPSRGHSPDGNRHHSHNGHQRHREHRPNAGKEAHGASVRHTAVHKHEMVMTAACLGSVTSRHEALATWRVLSCTNPYASASSVPPACCNSMLTLVLHAHISRLADSLR
jgi:hypothetical protein